MSVKLPLKNEPCAQVVDSKQDARQESPQVNMIDKIPVSLVLMLARPYIAGESAESAIELAQHLYKQSQYVSTLDILGEDMESDSTCDASVRAYKHLVDTIVARPLDVERHEKQITISLKPSMFSTRAPEEGAEDALVRAYERIKDVTSYAKEKNINVTLEAEDHRWTDFHLSTNQQLINQGFTNLGTVIQTRLFRTEDDIKRFDDRMRVRLVIGIYNESAAIAHTDKVKMKELLVDYAGELLSRGTYVEIATHDLDCVHNFFKKVVIPNQVSPERFELQFLHGVPRDELQHGLVAGTYFSSDRFPDADGQVLNSLATSGVVVRKYLPYGENHVAGAYCRRRLQENPNMVTYGIKNFFRWQK